MFKSYIRLLYIDKISSSLPIRIGAWRFSEKKGRYFLWLLLTAGGEVCIECIWTLKV